MKKLDLLRNVVAHTENGYSQKVVEEVLEAYADVVLETLRDDKEEKVPMLGIGNFTAKHVGDRRGVSKIGEEKEWFVPAHDELKLSISKSVKGL